MKNNFERLRIGVCGVGSIGFRHARLLSQRNSVELYIGDTTPAHLEAAASLPNLAGSTGSFDELIGSGLDALVIATPDRFHVEQAEAACRKKIAVLIEKPIAETAAQGNRLNQCALESGNRILVGYPLRFNALFLKAREIMNESVIGNPVSFSVMLGAYNTLVAAKNRFSPSDRNTLFVDYSHEWDYINWFLGKVRRVAAISHQSGDMERTQNPNVVDGVFELESGISGTVHLDYVHTPGKRTFTIIGDKGTMVVDAVKGTVSVQVYREEFERVHRIVESFDQMMQRQHDHFIDVIGGKAEPKVTVEDGLNALRVADAMIAACDDGTWNLI
ncbi:MAG TPA: Gfo/Idh/MocA family oxidoreductase [Pyrinomonadaceae bacterium]|nr:Gfo/Idh/MocA family oxidoreductase [Pyrinomonadaceae bacterium]